MSSPVLLISGASGFIGSALMDSFRKDGRPVYALVRRDSPFRSDHNEVGWNPETGELQLPESVEIDAVIHLAGSPILRFWRVAYKQRLWQSRVPYTRNLARYLAHRKNKPKTILVASASGYYGDHGTESLTEDSPPAGDPSRFRTQLALEWESATDVALKAGIRIATLRLGAVIGRDSVFIKSALPAIKLGLGSTFGRGHNYVPWVMIEDVVAIVKFVLENENLSGPINVAAPEPATQRAMLKAMAGVVRRPAFLVIPSLVLKLILGEFATDILTASIKMTPAKLQASGYEWLHPRMEPAIRTLLTAN